MNKIVFPAALNKGDCIAITAPSSGVEPELHHLLIQSKAKLEQLGYVVLEGETIWSNDKCVSTTKVTRVRELECFLIDDRVKAVIPPWGGEFLMELLPLVNWKLLRNRPPKWILGYSDISTFTFAYTLLTGHATAHGPNYIDLGSVHLEQTAARWLDVLGTEFRSSVKQRSSLYHRSAWDKPSDIASRWDILGNQTCLQFSGRLIGGCIDTISVLIGTPYSPVEQFCETYCSDDGKIWYLESCEMSAADLYRHLWQMKENGWFVNTNGILFGRAAGYSPTKNFELIDALSAIFCPLHIPVLYNVDVGHIPPQLTLVNGAFTEVLCVDGRGEVTMTFR